jgi:hypothetical protein
MALIIAQSVSLRYPVSRVYAPGTVYHIAQHGGKLGRLIRERPIMAG